MSNIIGGSLPQALRWRLPTISRGVTVAAIVLVVGLLPLLVIAQSEFRAASRAALRQQDGNLTFAGHSESTSLAAQFERARAIDLLLAENPALPAFYAAPGTREQKLTRELVTMRAINGSLRYLETVLYPGSIGEACIIDRHGPEIARAVAGT